MSDPRRTDPGGALEVALEVPALPEFLYLIRLNASGIAGRHGFSFEDIDDLRLAIDELCFGVIGPEGSEGMIRLVYRAVPDGLVIEGRGPLATQAPTQVSEWSEQILTALVDEHEVSNDGEGRRFRLMKRPGPRPDAG